MSNKPNQVTKVKEPLVRVTKRDVVDNNSVKFEKIIVYV